LILLMMDDVDDDADDGDEHSNDGDDHDRGENDFTCHQSFLKGRSEAAWLLGCANHAYGIDSAQVTLLSLPD
jgi:hypothetical protein